MTGKLAWVGTVALLLLLVSASCGSGRESSAGVPLANTAAAANGTGRAASSGSAAASSTPARASTAAAATTAAPTSAPAATPRGPSSRFTALLDSALQNGFLLEDRRGRRASVERLGPTDHWAFPKQEGPGSPRAVFRIQLSDRTYSSVVELEEWHLATATAAREAVDRVEGDGPGWQFYEAKLKGHHAFWIEGEKVYLVYSRALMFDQQFNRMMALVEKDARAGSIPCRHAKKYFQPSSSR